MQRRYSPARRSESILLYGFGLALALSLTFNGFLLYKQSHQRGMYEYDLSNMAHPMDHAVCQQQLSDCLRASQQKDSLISQLEHTYNAPPDQGPIVQRTASK